MKYILTIMIFSSLFSFSAQALIPRRHKWINIKSDNFSVLAPKEYRNFAEKTAVQAERARETLKALTSRFPKTTVIIIDPTKDYANGQATFFPYEIITLQPVAPSASTSIGQYNSWLYELLLHEYTHILSFHNHRNLYRPLRWLFGSTISPATFLPRWYLEGFAVYTESFLTNGGRLKSARYKAMQELFSKKGEKIHISTLSEQDLDFFPHGENPYFFGGWLNQESLKDIDKAKKIHKKFSGRMPFLIPSAYKGVTKKSLFKTWRGLFSKNKKTKKKKDQIKLDFIGRDPIRVGEKIYFIGKDLYQTDVIKEYDLSTKKVKEIARSSRVIHQFQIVNNSVYFISTNKREYEKQVFELFKAKIGKYNQEINKPVSKNLRSRNFHVLGKRVIFSQVDATGDSIFLTKLDNLDERSLIYKNKAGSRVSFTFFSKKDKIIFAEKEDDLDEKVFSLNLNSKVKKELFSDEHINFISPSKGSFVILSERKGDRKVTNLANLKSKTISRLITSIDSFTKNAWVSRLTLEGSVVEKINISNIKNTPQVFKAEFKTYENKSAEIKKNIKIKEKKYSSLSRLKPNYVLPIFALSPYGFSGETLYGVSTGSSDPLKFNSYSFSVFTDSITEEVSGSFDYVSRHLAIPIGVSVGKFYEPINLVDVRNSSYAQITTSASLSPNSDFGWSIGGGLLWDETNFNSIKANRGGVNLNLSYKSSRLRARELAPRSGLDFGISNTYFAPVDETYTDYNSLSGSLRKYFKSPLIKSHRLMLGFDTFWSNDLLLQTYAPISRNNPLTPGFTLRGLPTGAIQALEFYGVGHLEYKFPLIRFNWGPGLWPIFLDRVTGAIVSDFGVVSGANRIIGAALDTSELLASAGLEFTLETTVAYNLPLNFQVGIYNYLDKDFYDQGPELFIGFQAITLPF